MTIGQRQVWAKVLDFTVQDYTTKDLLFKVNYAQDAKFSDNYEKLEIRGGSDNEVQATIYHTPTALFSASLPLIDDNVLIAKTGAVKRTGVAQTGSFDYSYTVNSTTAKVTIDVTPKSGTLKIYNIDDDENIGLEIEAGDPTTEVEEYSIVDDEVTFNTAKKGKKVFIMCDYTTDENATGLYISTGKLPALIRVTAKAKVEDKAGNKAIKTIVIEKAKSDPSFELSTQAGQANTIPFECEVFGFLNEYGENQFYKLVTDVTLPL
jgi:hypothetical protein